MHICTCEAKLAEDTIPQSLVRVDRLCRSAGGACIADSATAGVRQPLPALSCELINQKSPLRILQSNSKAAVSAIHNNSCRQKQSWPLTSDRVLS